MNRTILALLLAGFAAAPAFAAGGMTCADFSALDGGAQADMVASMPPAGDAGGMMMAGPGDDDAAGTMMSDGDASGPAAATDDSAGGDDASGSMMSGGDASGSMMSGGDDAGAMSSDDVMDNDMMTANVAALCADHPDMSLDDAMSGASN